MVRTFLLVAVLAAVSSSAQTVTLKYSFQDATTYKFNKDSCSANVRVVWTSTVVNTPCRDLKIWSTELECQDNPGSTDVTLATVTNTDLLQLKTNTITVPIADLPGFKYSDAGVVCGTDAVEKQHRICAAYGSNGGITTAACVQQVSSALTLSYDTKPPVAPTIDAVLEQDGALTFKFSATADAVTVRFYARAPGETEFSPRGELATSAGSSLRISNLVNGTTYDVIAKAEDGAKNLSVASEIVAATPRLTKGFWARYRDAGGAQTGGCTAVHGLPLLLAGGLWLLRRKRN